jgi:hypothetical protein
MDSNPDLAWIEGSEAGSGYFNAGILGKPWIYSDASPYPKGTEEDEAWLNGFSFGLEAAESSYESC